MCQSQTYEGKKPRAPTVGLLDGLHHALPKFRILTFLNAMSRSDTVQILAAFKQHKVYRILPYCLLLIIVLLLMLQNAWRSFLRSFSFLEMLHST